MARAGMWEEVLEENAFTRVGGNEEIKTDVRIISATNKDLKRAVASGEFREDLYYRLNVVTIELPLLRERREDILLLAEHFLDKFASKNQERGCQILPRGDGVPFTL